MVRLWIYFANKLRQFIVLEGGRGQGWPNGTTGRMELPSNDLKYEWYKFGGLQEFGLPILSLEYQDLIISARVNSS